MNKNLLYSKIELKGMQINEFLEEVNNEGVKLSKSAFYSRIKEKQQFDAKQIKAIVKVLKLTKEDMNDIFFKELVS
ncbi:BetR domain protein [Staphylococcus hominis]|uniref:BetR domain protein n=1 Tax=Staphylococcus hominis TaxID=1290 RepID=UPI002DBCA6E2|nr:BetR domain protein [Staphylococcus hominis]MEB5793929.1 BetR domain protein [Staphylococcus hominis]